MLASHAIDAELERLQHHTVLSDGPQHRVVQLATDRDGASRAAARTLIAKYYRDDEGACTARVMTAIGTAIDSSPARTVLDVPRLLAYDAARRLIVQELAPGLRFDMVLSGSNALNALELAGRALADLHGLDAMIGPAATMRDHLYELVRPHPAVLAREVPTLRLRIKRILRTLLAADNDWRNRRVDVVLHRDVHPKQLFLDGCRVCLIDWDLSARGDAALDVGNFVAYLRARCQMDDAAIDAVTRGYAAVGARDTLARVPLYEAFTYLRLACKQFRLGADGWREPCAALISRAELCLGLR